MEDDSAIKKVGIAKLNGVNYRPWAAIAKAVIEAKDAWEAVEPSGPEAETPVRDTDDGTAGPSMGIELQVPLPVDRIKDAKARTIIMGYCGPEALSRILHLRTAREQWKELERAYLPLGRQQLSTALQRFYGFTPKSNASVNAIVTELREAQMDIFSIDPLQKPTDESTTVILFNALRSVNPAYGPITLQLELQSIQKFEVIVGHLEEAERRLAAMNVQPESALWVDDKKATGKGKGKMKCWHCNKTGHVKVKCYKWLKDTDEGRKYAKDHPDSKTGPLPTPGAKGNLSPERVQVVRESAGEVCWEAAESPRRKQDWILDSGASRHMTPNREAFIEYSTIKPRAVETANGSVLPGIGLGKIRLSVKIKGRTRSVLLSEVLHVPQIKGNLISVTKLQDKGMAVETTVPPAKKALIVKYQGRTVGMASRVGDTFILDVPTDRAFPAKLITERTGQGSETAKVEYVRWHRRFGHIGPQIIAKLHTVTDDLGQAVEPAKDQPTCEVCARTKKIRVVNRVAPERSVQPLARVFSDFWGPYRVPALTGERYMLTFTDDYTRKSWVVLTIVRASLSSVFARWKAFVELQSGYKLLAIRSDNASEYKSLGESSLAPSGIALELTTVYTPEQNGVSERLNRSLVTMARSMLLEAKLPARFWGEAVIAACYLRNRMAIGPDNKSPEEAFTGRRPSTRHLRTFGCIAYADIPSVNRAKLEPTARKTIFVGYMPTSKQYRLYDPVTKTIIVSSNPRFEENEFWEWSSESREPGEDLDSFDPMEPVEIDLDELLGPDSVRQGVGPQSTEPIPGGEEPRVQIHDPEQPRGRAGEIVRTPQETGDDMQPQGAAEDRIADEMFVDEPAGGPVAVRNGPRDGKRTQAGASLLPVRRSGRERRPVRFFDQARVVMDKPDIPLSYEAAVNDKIYGQYWKDAIEDELIKLQTLNTWEETDLPDGRRTVGSKWVFSVKYTPTGLIDKFKARLVAQGFSQIHGTDFEETFSPTVRLESLRTLLAIGACLDYEIHQTDIVSAYPRSVLHAEVFMRAPKGVEVPKGKCLRVLKSLYGLRQSGREWHLEAAKGLAELGLEPIFADACVFVREDKSLIIGLYVDDMVILANDISIIREFKEAIAKRWEIKDLGEVKKILGLEVTRNRQTRSIRITQSAFTDEIISEYGFTGARPASTPSGSSQHLEPTSASDQLFDVSRYQRVIGQLMYLMRGTRPDICFVVSRLSRYVARPAEKHWKCAMQVLRYLKGTCEYGTAYLGHDIGQKLEGYVDSDYAGDVTDRKSTYGSVFMLYGGPVAWTSRKQQSVSTSTTEAEYVALCQGNKEAIWFRRLLRETGFNQFLGDSLEVQIYSDNQGCIALAENPESHSRSKHIGVQYHYSRQLIEYKKIKLNYCPTEDMLADVLTKPLGARAFRECSRKLTGP